MKKKLFTLILAIAMCLGLTITTQAKSVDPFSLDAATAKIYADILLDQITQNGIRSDPDYGGIQYAALEDMDANGIPELIVIDCEAYDYAHINIWTIRNGKAVHTVDNQGINSGNVMGEICYARKNGQTKIYYYGMRASWGQAYDWYGLIGADGTITKDNNQMVQGREGWESVLNEDATWIRDTTPLLKGEGLYWTYSETQARAVHTLSENLTTQANKLTQPVASTKPTGAYGPYTIREDYYTITFDKAIVEEKVIEMRAEWEEYDEFDDDGIAYSTYDKMRVTLITIPQGSNISVTNHNVDEEFTAYYGNHVYVDFVTVDGNNRYTLQVVGAAQAITTGKVGATFEWDLSAKAVSIGNYLIEISSDTANTNTTATAGFMDVPSNAYYAAPVSWAIEKAITKGTGTNTFSPDNTCTVGEILTFLWRAKGQPEPTAGNPFYDIKASDYYYKAAVWAAENGLVTGSRFSPNTPCTRSMVVTYLWKLAGSPASASSAGFSDVPANAAYAQAVSWAIRQQITNGDGDNTFSPNKTCTRGQIVTFLYRALA